MRPSKPQSPTNAFPSSASSAGPEDAGELFHNVALRLENAKDKMKFVADVLDLMDQRDLVVDLLVERALLLLQRVAEGLEVANFLVGLAPIGREAEP